jgi:hypothetical protein
MQFYLESSETVLPRDVALFFSAACHLHIPARGATASVPDTKTNRAYLSFLNTGVVRAIASLQENFTPVV